MRRLIDHAAAQDYHVLVGGNNRTVSLQPLSVQGQVGINLAVGVTEMELVATR